tara:strand:- start:3554 stop:3862 length:309 start_codon:yes stop_codon:yes gene_type:complete
MKKQYYLLSSLLILSIGVTYASTKTDGNSIIKVQQEPQDKATEKKNSYDFSLFKFITPTQVNEPDTLKQKVEETTPQHTPYKETTDLPYQNPRSFFKLSYAS